MEASQKRIEARLDNISRKVDAVVEAKRAAGPFEVMDLQCELTTTAYGLERFVFCADSSGRISLEINVTKNDLVKANWRYRRSAQLHDRRIPATELQTARMLQDGSTDEVAVVSVAFAMLSQLLESQRRLYAAVRWQVLPSDAIID